MYNKNTKNINVKYIISILLFELVLLEDYTYIASRYAYRGWNTMIQLQSFNQFRSMFSDISMFVMTACKIIIVLNLATASASLLVLPIFSPRALAHSLHTFFMFSHNITVN